MSSSTLFIPAIVRTWAASAALQRTTIIMAIQIGLVVDKKNESLDYEIVFVVVMLYE